MNAEKKEIALDQVATGGFEVKLQPLAFEGADAESKLHIVDGKHLYEFRYRLRGAN